MQSVRRARPLGLLSTVLLLVAALLGACSPQTAGALAVPPSVTVTGLDLHDGQIQKFGSTYYLYGTMYACGYQWFQNPTPWCGFGVSTASSMNGPWSTPVRLFYPTSPDPYEPGHTYQYVCGQSSSGCWSPRMIQRTGWGANDGVFVLWFNAPAYMNSQFGSAPHGYMAMGCNGPAGPCGASAGAPYGTTYRPVLHQCNGSNGDAGLTASVENNAIALICPMAGATATGIEQLDKWGTNGTNVGSTSIAGLNGVEAFGAWRDPATGTWVMTYSDARCGYCTGTGTSYATAPHQLGPWTAPANPGVGAPANGRRSLTSTSCGGQPDTVSLLDGQAWQKVDLWTGAMNETAAGLYFEPLTYDPTLATGTAGDGRVWHPPFADWTCN